MATAAKLAFVQQGTLCVKETHVLCVDPAMCTSKKDCLWPWDKPSREAHYGTQQLSVAEELALLTGAELFDASQETSRVYNGHVIAKAIVIVQIRIHCPSLPDLARRIGVSKSIVYRHAAAHPLSDAMLHRAIRDLAILLDEEGVRR